MSSTVVLANASRLRTYGEVHIDAEGTLITTETTVKRANDGWLEVGDSGGGRGNSVSSMSFSGGGGGSIICGGRSKMRMNGIDIESSGGELKLTGPPSTRLVVNGVRTTFGALLGTQPQVAEPARKTYKLAPGTKLEEIAIKGGGDCSVAAAFLDNQLSVAIEGAGTVPLPAKTFTMLTLMIAGSGDVQGVEGTNVDTLNAMIAGSGDISGIKVLGSGQLTIAGSGDISVSAVNPARVHKSVVGSGDIKVRRAAAEPRAVEATPVASGSKKRSLGDDGDRAKRGRAEE